MLPRSNPNHDRLFKVCPFFAVLRENLKKIETEEHLVVDEIIILFKGCSTQKLYVKNTPSLCYSKLKWNSLRLSNHVEKGTVCESYLGINGKIVMKLEIIPVHKNINWFASHSLLLALKHKAI